MCNECVKSQKYSLRYTRWKNGAENIKNETDHEKIHQKIIWKIENLVFWKYDWTSKQQANAECYTAKMSK